MILAVEMFEGLMAYGYVGIIVYMVLTGCGLPMPEEVAIIAGGVLAANGQLHPWLTLGALLIGALLGDSVMYFLGYHFGRRVLTQHPMWTGFLTPEREKKVEHLIARHGFKVLFVARFLVGLRGPMYLTAGILKMPFKKFLIADLVCATVVVTLFFGVSYIYGDAIARALREGEETLTIIVIVVAVLAGGVMLWLHLRRKKAFDAAIITAEVVAQPESKEPAANDPPADSPPNDPGEEPLPSPPEGPDEQAGSK